MNDQVRDALIEKILAEWADKGKIVEGGWHAFVMSSRRADLSGVQLSEMRKAYMLGAQHLFSCIMTILDPGEEPTERDLKRMDLIHNELEEFRRSLTASSNRTPGWAEGGPFIFGKDKP
jgi:hypothetical protein